MAALHAGDLAYRHIHPGLTAMPGQNGGPSLPFSVDLPEKGTWQLFLQVQRAGGTAPAPPDRHGHVATRLRGRPSGRPRRTLGFSPDPTQQTPSKRRIEGMPMKTSRPALLGAWIQAPCSEQAYSRSTSACPGSMTPTPPASVPGTPQRRSRMP